MGDAKMRSSSSSLLTLFPNAPPVRSSKFLLQSISRTSVELGEAESMHNFNAMRDYVNELMVKDARNKQDL